MLRGHLDNVTSLGYIEGWALDTEAPTRIVEVAVMSNDVEIAWGLAHRFREDLMAAGLGLGWCAYRLRVGVPMEQIQAAPARLVERREGTVLYEVEQISTIEDEEPRVASMEALAHTDPTVIQGIWQLRLCDPLFMQFIRQNGLDTFLGVAYAYVLGRPADESGMALYSRLIREATLTPVRVLEALEDSDEFRSRLRQLAAPNSPTFPFQ